jgi:spore cortex biosynthesis protein YabQ
MTHFSQEQVFLLFIIIGFIIGILYDTFKAFRKSIKVPDIVTFVQDTIFMTLSGTLIILGVIKINNGEIRFFLFLGIFFGILIYLLTISNLYVIILYEFIEVCKKIFKIPIICIKKLIKVLFKKYKKEF